MESSKNRERKKWRNSKNVYTVKMFFSLNSVSVILNFAMMNNQTYIVFFYKTSKIKE